MAESNVKQLPGRLEFRPHTTLGRNGNVPSKRDRMNERLEHLDALLCLVTNDIGEEEGRGFQNLNTTIQASVLYLASRLATEVHELHTELEIESWNKRASK